MRPVAGWFKRLRVLDEMDNKPKILLLENVAGLLSTNGGDNYRVLHLALVERGYRCGAVLLNASHFVPQSRPRVFIIAVQEDCQFRGGGKQAVLAAQQRRNAVRTRTARMGLVAYGKASAPRCVPQRYCRG